MMTLQFVDTHNLFAFLAKPTESEGFEQIIDFLNANTIKYALTVNPTIYTSCIEQFWATIKVKTVNREQQLQALVDGKKIIITEATVRRYLQLEDAEGFLFSSMEIPYSYYFAMPNMVKNLDNAGKFLMYPRFIQVFLDNQLEGMSSHKRIYVTPSHTKKIFANMRRQGKDFSRRETPLFPTMVVQAQEEMGEGSAMPTDPHHTPIITQPSSSQPQRKQKSRRPKEKDTQVPQSSVPSDPTNVADEAVNEEPKIILVDETRGRYGDEDMFGVNDLDGDEVVVESEVTNKAGEKRNIVEEAVAVTNVVTIPVSAATITNVELTLAQTLAKLKSARPKIKGIVMQEPSESTPTISLQLPSQVKGQGSKDKGKGKMIEPDKPLKKKDQIKLQAQEQHELTIEEKSALFVRKHFAAKKAEEKRNRPPTRAQQRSIMYTHLKIMAGWKPKDLKSKSFANIQELFDKSFKRVNTFVDFRTELVEGSEVKAEGSETREESSSKRAGDELEQENAKKQKMDDDQEAAKMKELIKLFLMKRK
ncbi:hypothetical protein Tco_0923364 [Tanacetum coccineum]|uniref:Xylulose kinase-1 n=1 Tax=Tanacetum coccineum TaxID=301880 RepID=A0ABQ5D0R3_9ASTR